MSLDLLGPDANAIPKPDKLNNFEELSSNARTTSSPSQHAGTKNTCYSWLQRKMTALHGSSAIVSHSTPTSDGAEPSASIRSAFRTDMSSEELLNFLSY
ncbi:hypothetical protein BIW11_03579 [Tropilaelaps mercedesae]|uniref:Uncharacterized protein n=1 Tax=Tropilaelaps mercedesae TaxID=418985 RepID=A0A1V9XJ72_9ACAR|nr:hypothetical protein BIW11_03579 [Tropilaelaps mercedesae]